MIRNFGFEIIVIIFFYLVFSTVSLVTLNAHIDENESHLPTLKNFYTNDFYDAVSNEDYHSASTPLPYILVSGILRILDVEPTLFSARLINIIISLITLFLFIKLFNKYDYSLIYPSLILFFYPYFLKPSFAFFMSIYGLMFFLMFLLMIDKKNIFFTFLSGLCLAAAILTQQFYLIVFMFYAGYLIYKTSKSNLNSESIFRLLFFLIPIIIPAVLFIVWQGLVHPNYRSWGVSLNLSTVTSVIVTLGAVFLPYSLFNLDKINFRSLIIITIISILLITFAYPVWVNQPTPGGISGLTFNFLIRVNTYNAYLSFGMKLLFSVLGISTFLSFYIQLSDEKIKLYYFLFIVLAIGFALNKLPSERHMLPLIVTGLLLAITNVRKEIMLKIWLGYQIIIGSVYFYYIMVGY